MKFRKIDFVFLIVYVIILILLVLFGGLTSRIVGIPENPHLNEGYYIFWDKVAYVLLYAILTPVIYFGIRWYYQKKKQNV